MKKNIKITPDSFHTHFSTDGRQRSNDRAISPYSPFNSLIGKSGEAHEGFSKRAMGTTFPAADPVTKSHCRGRPAHAKH
jgi:hypothetical protein